MIRFERTRRLARLLYAGSGLLVFIIIFNASRFYYDPLGSGYVLLFVFCLLLATALTQVAKDAEEAIRRVDKLSK
ncbi:hypothetical protein DES38_11727 [Streptohalobacillus salinus]|uniref:YrhC-like protein n=1 Tax=Streptohalobacillus salinus TaxID=621096 RepID=A0A2V3WED0_9BACI|nr:hypothetical protein [Streptohalobacillus salinus]PXW87189.1 hypothetical protein DES38_11727 [Streptohalobacillus salinus]